MDEPSPVPDTPAGIDRYNETVSRSYQAGYRDGATEVARSFGHTVIVEDENEAHRFPLGTLIFCAAICAIFLYGYVISETSPRVEKRVS